MYFNLGDRVKLIFLHCTVKFTALKLKVLQCQSSRKKSHGLRIIKFHSQKDFDKKYSCLHS